jgi:hypothetical protein
VAEATTLAAALSAATARGAPSEGQEPAEEAGRATFVPPATHPERQGGWIAGGVVFTPEGGGNTSARVEVGVPQPVGRLEGLRFLVPVLFDFASAGDIDVYTLVPFAAAQHAWAVSRWSRGYLSALGELGVGPAFVWVRLPDQPFEPAHTETHVGAAVRLAGAMEVVPVPGFLVTVQPVGLLVLVSQGETNAAYEMGLRLGYQWR